MAAGHERRRDSGDVLRVQLLLDVVAARKIGGRVREMRTDEGEGERPRRGGGVPRCRRD